MKYVCAILMLLSSAPLAAMQTRPKTELKTYRLFKINPNDRLEIEQSLLIHIKGKKENAKELPAPKFCAVEILATMDITKEVELPYLIAKDGNTMRIYVRPQLDKIGITLKELIITVPQAMPVAIMRSAS